ncbi:MAG: hypothetical protein HXX19_15250 [Rhodoferax sp.]|nr:hypothetical protein [Rhodoferax sp.]
MTRRLAMPTLPGLYGMEPSSLPGFELTFICGGHSFKAFQRGRNVQAAAHEALIELGVQCPDFDALDARLVAAVQTQ